MDRKRMRELFSRVGRFGTLSTADNAGRVNCAIFGSGRLTDEYTLILGLGGNRTLSNLKENPKAVFMFFEPGETLLAWKGARLYLDLAGIETSGAQFEEIVAEVTLTAGKMAASSIRAAATFKIDEVRPIIDLGSKNLS
ncbi:pyridoxamine 5'-phosphate oxidase family protein [Trichloromonas sp.]|uniref:pyridoxamine 5'-phosphate oxidase family protein n=1 Tax=Trichloromonas sp. TaxID=3069249 RepID=UPI003D8169F1